MFSDTLYIFTGLLHLVYCQEMELKIISEANFITLWPFSFFPWLISLALCPIQFLYTNLRLLNFSAALIDSEVKPGEPSIEEYQFRNVLG